MSEHPTGRVRPTGAQPAIKLGESLPEFVSHEEMKAQAQSPFAFKYPLAPTVQGVRPPTAPGGPIAAAPKFPTPAPRNVKE